MTASSSPPSVIHDRYQLAAWLGEGSMGVVYRAHDLMLDRDVAVKFLLPQCFSGEEAAARFLREARLVARLSHPNIMSIFDVGEDQGWKYLIVEYIPGTDLQTLMSSRSKSWSAAETMPILKAALEALAYAHGQGVIHRDIKPENIMITPPAQVKVMDFGLAREEGLLGTVQYMSPEMIQGTGIDARTDLYSLGVVLYALLAGEQFAQVFPKVIHSNPIPLRERRPDLPPAIEGVVTRLMMKEPDQRFASAHEALRALAYEPDGAGKPLTTGQETLDQREPLMQDLLLYASTEDVIAALESERRRMSGLLKNEVIEPLNLLLSQAGTYEKTLGGNQMAHMAVSVLSTLARQILQQVRDLDENLLPRALESMGLEPALENLAGQVHRNRGLQVSLELVRLPERLPGRLELSLFRLCQDYFDAIQQIGASRVHICLKRREEDVEFELSNNAHVVLAESALAAVREWIEQLGGTWSAEAGRNQITVHFRLAAPIELTRRELEIIRLVAEGLSNKQIAQVLSISARTVNFHLDNLFAKLGVRSRTEAAILALRRGWIERTK